MAEWRRNQAPDKTKGVYWQNSSFKVRKLVPPDLIPAKAIVDFNDSHGFNDKLKTGDQGTIVRFVFDVSCTHTIYHYWWIPSPLTTTEPCQHFVVPGVDPPGPVYGRNFAPSITKGIWNHQILLPPSDVIPCDPRDERSAAVAGKLLHDSHGSLDVVQSYGILGPLVRILENAYYIVSSTNVKIHKDFRHLRMIPGSIFVAEFAEPHDCCQPDCCDCLTPPLKEFLVLHIVDGGCAVNCCTSPGCATSCGDFILTRISPQACEWTNLTDNVTCSGGTVGWRLKCNSCTGWTLTMAVNCIPEGEAPGRTLIPISGSCDPIFLDFGLVDMGVCCGIQGLGCILVTVTE